jgi:hypothetical protein
MMKGVDDASVESVKGKADDVAQPVQTFRDINKQSPDVRFGQSRVIDDSFQQQPSKSR